MVRIACYLPQQEMVEQAWRLIEQSGIDWKPYQLTIDYGPSCQAIEWSQWAQREKVDIIVARGLQATHIKQHTAIPVVEIRLTGQEMGLLMARAKAMVNKSRPLIGVVGYANQFCNMESFHEIFDIDMRCYYVTNERGGPNELSDCAMQAVRDRVDLIVGGTTAQNAAQEAGIPGLYITSTGDSFLEAFRSARRMAYAIELEKTNTAQIRTLLDNAFGVIVRTDAMGNITLINHVAETLLGWKAQQVIGRPLSEIAAGMDPELLTSVLREGAEIYSKYVSIGKISLVANMAPIQTDSGVIGAILSAQEVEMLEEMGTAARQHQYRQERVASTHLSTIAEPSREMRQAVALAEIYSKSDAPVLIRSEQGNGQERFAQAIHNESKRKDGPFVSVNCAEADAAAQLHLLFGGSENKDTGLLGSAHGGTALLENVQGLAPACQHRLLGLMRDGTLLAGSLQPCFVNVRIIATCDGTLPRRAQEGGFSQELYYMLNTLLLPLSPLRARPEDIRYWTDYFLKRYREHYKRYITLTAGGVNQLCAYRWSGNLLQIKAFCQRLILTAQRRTLDENDIQRLFLQMYPPLLPTPSPTPIADRAALRNEEEALIRHLLSQHGGNRGQVAAEMGVSTTTLWRRMKKYDIQNPYICEKEK